MHQDSWSVLPQEASYADDEEEVDEEQNGTGMPPGNATVYYGYGVTRPDFYAPDDGRNKRSMHRHMQDYGKYV